MARFTRSERIERPLDEVWAFFDDLANAPKWIAGLSHIAVVGSEPKRKGTRIKETRTAGGRTETNEFELTAYQPPHCYEVTARVSGGAIIYSYTFTAVGAATIVDLIAEVRVDNVFFKPFVPIGIWMIKKYDGNQLAQLKGAIEGEVPPAGMYAAI